MANARPLSVKITLNIIANYHGGGFGNNFALIF